MLYFYLKKIKISNVQSVSDNLFEKLLNKSKKYVKIILSLYFRKIK